MRAHTSPKPKAQCQALLRPMRAEHFPAAAVAPAERGLHPGPAAQPSRVAAAHLVQGADWQRWRMRCTGQAVPPSTEQRETFGCSFCRAGEASLRAPDESYLPYPSRDAVQQSVDPEAASPLLPALG